MPISGADIHLFPPGGCKVVVPSHTPVYIHVRVPHDAPRRVELWTNLPNRIALTPRPALGCWEDAPNPNALPDHGCVRRTPRAQRSYLPQFA